MPFMPLLSVIALTLTKTVAEVRSAMYSAPFGSAVTMLLFFLLLRLPEALPENWQKWKKILFTLCAHIIVYIILTSCIIYYMKQTKESKVDNVVGLSMLGIIFTIGISLVYFSKAIPAPKASTLAKWWIYIIRGTAGATMVLIVIGLGKFNNTLGGLLTAFPSVGLTSAYSLWITSENAVFKGALGPTIIGNIAPPTFAILYGELLGEYSAIISATIAFVITMFGLSIPIGITLHYKAQLSSKRNRDDTGIQLEENMEET